MRCLAVCHTELVIRLLEAVLTPSAELDVLVESRALARKFESSELPVSVDETDRIDSYVKLGVSPVMPVFIEDNGRSGLRKVLEAVRGAGAEYLLLPEPGFWWLDHYAGLDDYLLRHSEEVARTSDLRLYRLAGAQRPAPQIASSTERLT